VTTVNIFTTTQQPNLVSVTGPTSVALNVDVVTEEPNIVITAETSGQQGPPGPAGDSHADPRSVSIVSNGALTPNSDTTDIFNVTALAENATFTAPTGTPANGRRLLIRIKDDGTPRSLSFNSIYRAVGITLPTTTVNNKTIYLGMFYNSADTKWDVVAYALEA